MLMPGVLKTIFFARALRTSIAIVATCMFFLPGFSSGKGAFWGLLLATLGATGWFLVGNPLGIDNIYVAAAIPLVVMLIDHVLKGAGSGPSVERKTMEAGTQ
jgi:SSS family solute:Na+ symporter